MEERFDLAGKIIGCAMKVHRILGPGFLESVYQNAMLIELRAAGLKAEDSRRITVTYEGTAVGDFVADIFVEDQLIIENKACLQLLNVHEVQLVNYLTATGCETGVLLNFGAKSLQFRKKFRNLGARPSEVSFSDNSVNSVNSV